MCYIAEEHFRNRGVRNHARMILVSGESALFLIPAYSQIFDQLARDKGVAVNSRRLPVTLAEPSAAPRLVYLLVAGRLRFSSPLSVFNLGGWLPACSPFTEPGGPIVRGAKLAAGGAPCPH